MATKRITVRPQAKLDFNEESVYLAREAGAAVGIRFFDAVQETFQSLLDMPGMGKFRPVNNPGFAELR